MNGNLRVHLGAELFLKAATRPLTKKSGCRKKSGGDPVIAQALHEMSRRNPGIAMAVDKFAGGMHKYQTTVDGFQKNEQKNDHAPKRRLFSRLARRVFKLPKKPADKFAGGADKFAGGAHRYQTAVDNAAPGKPRPHNRPAPRRRPTPEPLKEKCIKPNSVYAREL